jgi:hypothetical protein
MAAPGPNNNGPPTLSLSKANAFVGPSHAPPLSNNRKVNIMRSVSQFPIGQYNPSAPVSTASLWSQPATEAAAPVRNYGKNNNRMNNSNKGGDRKRTRRAKCSRRTRRHRKY